MKRNIKKFLFPAVAVAVLSFAACSDWTETESLDINYPTLEEQNPELYKQYLKALRDYKAGEHKVVLVSMDNTTSAPAQRNEHLDDDARQRGHHLPDESRQPASDPGR